MPLFRRRAAAAAARFRRLALRCRSGSAAAFADVCFLLSLLSLRE